MLNARQTYLFMMAQAEMCRVEGMKAMNDYRRNRGESQAYDENAFVASASVIEQAAVELLNSG